VSSLGYSRSGSKRRRVFMLALVMPAIELGSEAFLAGAATIVDACSTSCCLPCLVPLPCARHRVPVPAVVVSSAPNTCSCVHARTRASFFLHVNKNASVRAQTHVAVHSTPP
jgi:hypothetical protein